MDSDSDSSDTNLVIIANRVRIKLFCKLYWKAMVLILTPTLLLPIYFLGEAYMFEGLYIFLITTIFWVTNVMHPGIISVVPFTLSTYIAREKKVHWNWVLPLGNELLDCLSIMIIVVAIEHCNLNRRVATKFLLMFGSSHYRLSLMLFFCSMFLSMWMSDIIACGLMMPLIKSILAELEKLILASQMARLFVLNYPARCNYSKLGILDMHHTAGKSKQWLDRNEPTYPEPTDITIFYFLGIAYSASTGSMATLIGSHANRIFKIYSESFYPMSPKIEFPHMILLNLPGALLMEALLYVWMNSYFLGMFRARNDITLEIGMSEEEAQYIKTLLDLQYQKLGKITVNEWVVGIIVILACVLQISISGSFTQSTSIMQSHLITSTPTLLCVVLLFVLPTNMDFLKFMQRHVTGPLPTTRSKSILNWNLVQNNINWSVVFVIVSSAVSFSLIMESLTLVELGDWPAPVQALLVVLVCKFLSELASNATAACCLLPTVARLSVASSLNPHYLMLAATLACSLPFHLITGSPVNAMVAAYVNIPPWKMMAAGIGPSVIAVVVVWFTVAVWSKAIWTDIHLRPSWADHLANITLTT